jgi:hypothetical protein
MNRTLCGLLATALLTGIGAARTQSAADIEAVTAANNAFYAAESALAWISQTRTYQGGEPGRHLHFSGTQDLVCW